MPTSYDHCLYATRELRNAITQYYGDDPRVLRFIAYLVNAPRSDDDTVLIPHELLAWCAGKKADNGKFVSEDFIIQVLQKEIPELEWKDYVRNELVREVTDDGLWPVSTHVEKYRSEVHSMKDMVNMVTGLRFKETKPITRPVDFASMHEVQKTVIELNRQVPDGAYRRSRELLDVAWEVADRLCPDRTTKRGTKYRSNTHKALEQVAINNARPMLNTTKTGHTMRLFDTWHPGWQDMKKEVKVALTPDWVHFDLSSCQLAAYAHRFDVPDVVDLLARGRVWSELMELCETEDKRAIKEAVYSLCFGAGASGVSETLTFKKIDPALFMSHPAVATLLQVRDEAVRTIKGDKRMLDAFGKEVRMNAGRSPLSVLAEVMQSYEFVLLAPVLNFIEAHPCLLLALWEHDGFSVAFAEGTAPNVRAEMIVGIQDSVADWCVELGFSTSLQLG